VNASLQTYTEDAFFFDKVGRYFGDIGYGYQWLSAGVGEHHLNVAWGHGGQQIVLLDELDIVIVTTADLFHSKDGGESWKHEEATINLVAEFIHALPSE
jgi:hypothetical protein